MTSSLFILNDAPYGNERAYNGLRRVVNRTLVNFAERTPAP